MKNEHKFFIKVEIGEVVKTNFDIKSDFTFRSRSDKSALEYLYNNIRKRTKMNDF